MSQEPIGDDVLRNADQSPASRVPIERSMIDLSTIATLLPEMDPQNSLGDRFSTRERLKVLDAATTLFRGLLDLQIAFAKEVISRLHSWPDITVDKIIENIKRDQAAGPDEED